MKKDPGTTLSVCRNTTTHAVTSTVAFVWFSCYFSVLLCCRFCFWRGGGGCMVFVVVVVVVFGGGGVTWMVG